MSEVFFSVGYAGTPIEAFAAFVAAEDLTVVDVRCRPFSRNASYNRKALAARFGDRYLHVPALGNVNYRGGPIAIADLAAGLEQLRALLTVRAVVVLCVCADVRTCHRSVITAALAAEGYHVVQARPTAEAQASPPSRRVIVVPGAPQPGWRPQ